GREDADLVPRGDAGAPQRPGDRFGELDDLAVGPGDPVEGQAGRPGVQGGAFLLVEEQRHRRPFRLRRRLVTTMTAVWTNVKIFLDDWSENRRMVSSGL